MSDEVEEWRAVAGYEGRYEVSDWGRVRSLDLPARRGVGMGVRRGRVRKLNVVRLGYETVNLKRDGKKKWVYVHRLVAAAFLGESSLYVNHKDAIKRNNKASNLEYVTHAENMAHSARMGLRKGIGGRCGADNPNTRISRHEAMKVLEMQACGFSARETIDMTGITDNTVFALRGNHTWRYLTRQFQWEPVVSAFNQETRDVP